MMKLLTEKLPGSTSGGYDDSLSGSSFLLQCFYMRSRDIPHEDAAEGPLCLDFFLCLIDSNCLVKHAEGCWNIFWRLELLQGTLKGNVK